jgi:hypothetical protein
MRPPPISVVSDTDTNMCVPTNRAVPGRRPWGRTHPAAAEALQISQGGQPAFRWNAISLSSSAPEPTGPGPEPAALEPAGPANPTGPCRWHQAGQAASCCAPPPMPHMRVCHQAWPVYAPVADPAEQNPLLWGYSDKSVRGATNTRCTEQTIQLWAGGAVPPPPLPRALSPAGQGPCTHARSSRRLDRA